MLFESARSAGSYPDDSIAADALGFVHSARTGPASVDRHADPMTQLIRLKTLPRWTYLSIWFLGFVWSCFTLQWLRLGHPAMYAALVALSFYIGMYFPRFIWLGRKCVSAGVPLWLGVAIVWTSLEYLRAWLMTGFSWYYLGHTQYRWISLIQISDITGAYGVSFLIAAINGAIAEWIPSRWLSTKDFMHLKTALETGAIRGVILSTSLLVAAVIYGTIRQTPADQFKAGPAMAMIQGNFDPETKADRSTMMTRIRVHEGLTQRPSNFSLNLSSGLRPCFLAGSRSCGWCDG